MDWQTVNSKAYHEKFAQITDSEKLNENLYKAAKEILNHRDGFMQEDLYLLDAETGKVLYRQTASSEQQTVTYTKAMNKVVRENKGKLVAVHNHPQGMPPSDGDINSLATRGYKTGVVVTHNGRVFAYEAGENFCKIGIQKMDFYIAEYKKEGYNDSDAQMKALEALAGAHNFSIREVVT